MKRVLRSVLVASMIVSMSGYSASTIQDLADKYPLTITAEAKDDFAEIRISGALYEWSNSTEALTAKIDKFLADGFKNVKVYINSPGGDVFVGAEIVNQLKRFPGKKQGFGGALVASAATIIAIEMDSFEMAENGQFMYHKPSGWISGNEDKIESQLTLLKNLTSQYKKMYADKTGISEEEIEANWTKGDVWLTASQAKDQKFITSVSEKQKVNKQTAEMIAACGGTPPKVKEDNIKPEQMKNRNAIVAMLKLSADATDEQIEAAVKQNVDSAGEVEQMRVDANAQRTADINAFIDQAITDKKITADLKDNYVALAKKDFDGTKAIIEAMQPVTKPEITPGAVSASGREKWTMENWMEKDPEGLKVLMVEKPEVFAKLEDDYFGK